MINYMAELIRKPILSMLFIYFNIICTHTQLSQKAQKIFFQMKTKIFFINLWI